MSVLPKPDPPLTEEVFASILSALEEGVVVTDPGGRILQGNRRAERLFGVPIDGLAGLDIEEFMPSCVRAAGRRKRQGARVTTGLPRRLTGHRRDGSTFPVEARCSSMQTADGPRCLYLLTDATAADEAASALWHSTARYQAQFKGFPLPSSVWQQQDGQLRLIDFNDAAEAFTDGEIRRILGASLTRVFPPPSEIADAITRCHATRSTLSLEVSFRLHRDDDPKILFVTCTFIAPDLVLSHMEDVTLRRRHEREHLMLSSAVEQTADSVMITDARGIIEYVNPAFETTTGYARLEVLGRTPRILKSGAHPGAFYDDLWTALRAGRPYRGTLINRKKSGELYWSEQTITPMKDAEGRISHFVSVLKDLTEARHRQEQEFQMGVAREMQERLCRPADPGPGFDLAGATYPAIAVNGDFYDVLRFADGTLGLVIADVCGHGIGAALVMAQTRALLRAFSEAESDPVALLRRLNRVLTNDLDDKHFVTLFLARIDPAARRLDYASAGHPAARLLRADGSGSESLASTSIPLGILEDLPSEPAPSLPLHPGDLLVLLTDGILEAEGPEEEQFGAARAMAVVERLSAAPAEEIVAALCREALNHSRPLPQQDDITALVCRIRSLR